jgi:hypothetical protein
MALRRGGRSEVKRARAGLEDVSRIGRMELVGVLLCFVVA